MNTTDLPPCGGLELELWRAQESLSVWQAAFLCCGLCPPAPIPDKVAIPLHVREVAQRLAGPRGCLLHKHPPKGELEPQEDDQSWTKALELTARLKAKRGLAPQAREEAEQERRAIIRGWIAEARNPGLAGDAFEPDSGGGPYVRRDDLRAWIERPENAPLRPLALFLMDDDEAQSTANPLKENERDKLLSIIGALALVAANPAPAYRKGENGDPNVSALAKKAIELISDDDGNPPYGLNDSTIRGTVSRGLAVLQSRTGKTPTTHMKRG